jgi:hypothetical protein
MPRRHLLALPLLLVPVAATAAPAPDATILTSAVGVHGDYFIHGEDDGTDLAFLDLQLGLDRRIGRLTVGASAHLLLYDGGGASLGMLEGGPRLGVLVPIGDGLRLWPSAGISFGSSWIWTAHDEQSYHLQGELYAPLLVDLGGRVFLGLGPYAERLLWTEIDYQHDIDLGVRATLGGWL